MKKTILTAAVLASSIAGASAQGLSGAVYFEDNAQLGPLVPNYLNLIAGQTPNATYLAHSFNYGGNDATPTNAFLNSNGSTDGNGTAALDTTPISTSVFDAQGIFTAPITGTYTFSVTSDDGSAVFLNGNGTPGSGTKVVEQECCGGPTNGTIQLAAGSYPIEIAYVNQNFNGGPGTPGKGGANFTFTGSNPNPDGSAGGAAINAAVEFSPVPEPSTWLAAGGILLLAVGDFRRRLKA